MHMWPGHTCDCWKWPICKDNDVDVVQFLSVFYFSYVCPLSREKNELSYNVWNDVGWGRALDSFYCKSSRFKNNILEYSVCLSITYPIQSVFIGSIIYALLPTCDPYVAPFILLYLIFPMTFFIQSLFTQVPMIFCANLWVFSDFSSEHSLWNWNAVYRIVDGGSEEGIEPPAYTSIEALVHHRNLFIFDFPIHHPCSRIKIPTYKHTHTYIKAYCICIDN